MKARSSSATRALSSKLFTYCITWRYTGENTRKIIPIPLSLCKLEQVREHARVKAEEKEGGEKERERESIRKGKSIRRKDTK